MIVGGREVPGTCAFHIVSMLCRFLSIAHPYARARDCERRTSLGNKFRMCTKASSIPARRASVQGRRKH